MHLLQRRIENRPLEKDCTSIYRPYQQLNIPLLIENYLKSKSNYLTNKNSNLDRRAPDQILKEIVDEIKNEKISEDAMEWMDQFEQWIKDPPDGKTKY